MSVRLSIVAVCLCWLSPFSPIVVADEVPAVNSVPAVDPESLFVDQVVPFLATHCNGCHGGDDPEADLSLARFETSANVQDEYALWERVLRVIEHREMPPADQTQPAEETLIEIGGAIRAQLQSFDCSGQQRPGRVTIRRLNRSEYNNTIRDLVGVAFRPADDFPSDDVGYGFDNMADVLSMSPILLEKYLSAAEGIVDQAFAEAATRGRIEIESGERSESYAGRLRGDIRRFASKAFRRPVSDEEVERLAEMAIAIGDGDHGDGDRQSDRGRFDNGPLRAACTAILTSPHFLFRIERDPESGETPGDEAEGDGDSNDATIVRKLDGYEIATRLSYFLWSSMPDDRLFELADRGELGDIATLEAEVDRMLRDDKARALVDNFAGQWLQLRDVAVLSPDPVKYPAFDEALRAAMTEETERFFEAVIREDRSVLDFLNADFSYINERLAKHYGMSGIEGDEFRRVALSGQRRGVLTHASILMLTSNPTRTSPVKRGQWILNNILGEPPPPPPPGVEELNDDDETLGSLREKMEQHRANPACAVCHRQMDALGFGLENFDGIGAWRDRDGRFEIDPSGELPGNQAFAGPAELMSILAQGRRDAFSRCLAEKVLTYGLGRGLGPYDRCAVNAILDRLAADGYRFSTLVKAVVTSEPFLYREVIGAE
jgi:hypothetical protein